MPVHDKDRDVSTMGMQQWFKKPETEEKKPCFIVQYGNEERLCKKCGYVMFNDKDMTDEQIIDQMIEDGYSVPPCRNNSDNSK